MLPLQNLARRDLAAAANANLVVHFSWVQQRAPSMRVSDAHDLVMVDSGLPCDTFNVVCRARLAAESACERIRVVIDYFAGVGRPFSWWLNPGDEPDELGEFLLAAGLHRAETEMAMAADLGRLPANDPAPNGLKICRVRTPAHLRDFATVVAANWTPPDPDVLRFYELAAPHLLGADSPLRQYVGYVEEIPVATAELTVGGGVVGLYNVCTLQAYRRRGFGSALTLQSLLDARANGHRTAILQSAADSLYARLGFEPFGEVTEYKP
jgi:ribosomal protein S18 acetylase RimI-like enzyme